MGAIISKLCCCTGRHSRNRNLSHSYSYSQSSSSFHHPTAKSSATPSKLSRLPSLIIERTQVLRDVECGGSEYSRVLERDFEIKGRKKSPLDCEESAYYDCEGVKRSGSIVKKFQLKHKETGQLFTLTRLQKSFLTLEASETLCREIGLLARELPGHPMLVNLYWTWQDEKYLYRVDDDIVSNDSSNGDSNSDIVSSDSSNNQPQSQSEYQYQSQSQSIVSIERIASQLALIIHYIHSYGMIHGNINPHAISLKSDPLKLGSFKYLRKMQGGKRLKGLCGDYEEFRAPECNSGEEKEGYFEEIDWYSYGKTLEYYARALDMPDDANFKDLICKLTAGGSPRLGYGPAGFKSIQSHPFFAKTDWPALLTQKTDPTDRRKYESLSASIESLKSQTERPARSTGWREFVEFSWEEREEMGQMLETIIKTC